MVINAFLGISYSTQTQPNLLMTREPDLVWSDNILKDSFSII